MNIRSSFVRQLLLAVTGVAFYSLWTLPAFGRSPYQITGICGEQTCNQIVQYLREYYPEQMAGFEAACEAMPSYGSFDKELNLQVGRFLPDEDPEYSLNMVKLECVTWDGKYGPEVEANDYYPVPTYLGALPYYP